MINVPLMRKVLEHITEHPEEHDQQSWAEKTACGTTYCMAGHAVLMAGHEIAWSAIAGVYLEEDGADRVTEPIETSESFTQYIPHVAAHELGIDHMQASMLFYDSTYLEELWEVANFITDGEIEVPEQFKEIV